MKYKLKAFQLHLEVLKSSSLVRKITKVFSGDVISRVIGLGTTILIIRGASVNDYAAYTAFYSIVIFTSGLVGSGINWALVRFSTEHISRTGRKPVELYFLSFFFQILLYCGLCIVMFSFSDKVNNLFFGQQAFESSVRYGLIGGMGLLIGEAGRCIFQAEERFGTYIKALWCRQFLAFGIISLLFLLGKLTFERTAQAVIFAHLFVAVIVSFYIFRDLNTHKIRLFLREQSGLIKELLSSTKWLIAYFVVLVSYQRLDVFMLAHFSSIEEVAVYGIAFRYYTVILLLRGSIHAVLLPKFSKVEMQDIERQRQFVFKWMKSTVWLIIPIVIFDIFGKPLFIWINGVQYEDAFSMFVIFSIGIWIVIMFSPLVNALIARKEFKFLFVTAVAALLFSALGNYFLIPLWGGLGAAVIVILTRSIILGLQLMKILGRNCSL